MRKGRCKHFTGTQNDTCEAGVSYESVGPGIPCLRMTVSGRERPCQGTCERYQEPTDAEVAEFDKFMDERMEMHRKVGPAIIAIKQEHKGKSWQGVIECPCCGGKLHVSHAAYNGHCHGRCETDGCIAWME